MTANLKNHFPIIRDREEILDEIRKKEHLLNQFESWESQYQEEFLNMCTGVKGVKLLYDSFFKAIMNPDTVPERLEEILSLLLYRNIKIIKVLPNESGRIAAENSLLVLDIVVELEDGSIANVEVQKIGYAFPGQRSACYSSDLLLRQYKRVRGERGKKFQYRDIKKVYTIVLLEKSTSEFWKISKQYVHRSKQQFDTGLDLEMLQEYVFVALDIFRKLHNNKGVNIRDRLEAWLTFLGGDNPDEVINLIQAYPEFRLLYEEVYAMCRNMENIMGLFSEELAILDKNTVDYMIDEMQNTIDEQQGKIDEQQEVIDEQQKKIDAQNAELEELKRLLEHYKE